MENTLRVLVTGAGAPGIRGTLYALRNNPDKKQVFILGTDIKSNTVGRYLVDEFQMVPSPESDEYLTSMIEVCKTNRISLILPQTTREIEVLSQQKEAFRAEGIEIMVSDAESINTANNKFKLLKTFEKLNLPYPEYYVANSVEELEENVYKLGYPENRVVVKPSVSNGMRGLRILAENAWNLKRFLGEKPDGTEISLNELKNILQRGESFPEILVTEYLPGVEYTVDCFTGRNGNLVLPRIRKSIRSGITFEAEFDFNSDIIDFSRRAAESIGLQYAYGFQYKFDKSGVPKILESNPRIQGTMVASIFTGINIIWLGVKDILGEDYAVNQDGLKPAKFYRYWGGIGVEGSEAYEI